MIKCQFEILEITGRLLHNFRLSIFTAAVENRLSEKKVHLNNILGLACDNTSIMDCEHISLAQKFLLKTDRSFGLIRCICHSAHIAASKAAMKLPRYLEDLLRNFNYFSQSSKRQAQLSDLQESLQTEKKIAAPCMRVPIACALCVC